MRFSKASGVVPHLVAAVAETDNGADFLRIQARQVAFIYFKVRTKASRWFLPIAAR